MVLCLLVCVCVLQFWVELMTVERNETSAMCEGIWCVWVLCCKFMLQYATYCHAYVFGACRWCGSYIWARDEKFFPLDISFLLLLFFPTYFHIPLACEAHTEPKSDGNEHFTNNIVLFSSFTWFCYHYYIYSCCFFCMLDSGVSFSVCVWIYSSIQKLPHDPTARCQHMKNEL